MNVYISGGRIPLSAKQLANWGNGIMTRLVGKKIEPFSEADFTGPKSRLNGFHCICGTEDGTVNSPSLGEFDLLSPESSEVRDGQKAYMVCRKCGCYSHL